MVCIFACSITHSIHNQKNTLKRSVSSLAFLHHHIVYQESWHADYFIELIPRPARSCEDPPLYLRLRMGKPTNRPIPRSTPLMSYGKKKMRPEYWFSVPRNRVDQLFNFIHAWVPHLYGELNEEQVSQDVFFSTWKTMDNRKYCLISEYLPKCLEKASIVSIDNCKLFYNPVLKRHVVTSSFDNSWFRVDVKQLHIEFLAIRQLIVSH